MLAVFCTFLLAACGGGGGSPGAIVNQPTQTPTATVSSLILTTSASTISSSGAPGSEVTITVLARDSRNVAVPGATISLTADSGAIVFDSSSSGGTSTATPGVTDSSGVVTAKLSIAGVKTLRRISIVASTANAVRSETKQVEVVAANSTVAIIPSSLELQSSGSITLTVLARDGVNNVIKGAKVNITSNSGALIVTRGVTDDKGEAQATLTAGNDPSARNIIVTAVLDSSAGGSDPTTATIAVKALVPKLSISASSGNLDSAGAAGTEVNIVVLVRDANNNVLSGAEVGLAASSGSLTRGDRRTNAQGIVTEKLSTGGDASKRDILVTATSPGIAPQSMVVTVSGTKVSLNASSSVNSGVATDMTVSVTDSSGKPLVNQAVVPKVENGSTLIVKNNGLAVTDGGGNLILTFTGRSGILSDTVTVTSLGVDAKATILINNSDFTVTPAITIVKPNTVAQGNINTCYPVVISNKLAGVPQSGTVSLGISRGAVYRTASCATGDELTGSLTLNSAGATAYVKAPSPGLATLVATLGTGVSTRGNLEFVAPLLTTANVILQVDPGVIGVNTVDTSQRAVVKAVVRDGSAANNLVKDASINFSIEQDGSGGVLLQPSVVKTGSDGAATVTFIAGPTATATDGVRFKGQIQSTVSSASATANLTVGRQALFITAGTGNTIESPTQQSYIQRYQILVTDAVGNPVQNANVTASILPVLYIKGQHAYDTVSSLWRVASSFACANEDINTNGILDAGEDINGNRRLEPGIPVTVNISGATDDKGATSVALQYAKDQANWLQVDLTIRATVAGSEAKYIARFVLRGATDDFNKKDTDPPGRFSPYGIGVIANSGGKLPCEYTE